ncbi:RiPP maturation radical SAM C-methyltransferase [Mycolicibacterium psychrotolerans]|uniref:RiPP maturation radical SAM C-methyltransferase n=1 Tax=Mycolicibacterium psychrotolerans TaxID=216929 RepID=UPI0021F35EE7|nr:RiPP maturation radical SAM C-methyltransferase [Mycolicibacterium psychrotolerans]
MPRVCLVQMPWGSAITPSLGLHVLETHLTNECLADVSVYYANLDFYEQLPEAFSTSVLKRHFWDNPCLFWLCDGIFATHAYSDQSVAKASQDALDRTIDRLVADNKDRAVGDNLDQLVEWLSGNIQDVGHVVGTIIPSFLSTLAGQLISGGYDVIGLGTFFNQTSACLSLARMLRLHGYSGLIILGGAGVTDSMARGLIRSFRNLDAVVVGDGELPLGEICRALATQGSAMPLSDQVIWSERRDSQRFEQVKPEPVRRRGERTTTPGIPVLTGDGYERFFKIRSQTRFAGEDVQIPFEISRGCYWVARSKCTFCGIADDFKMKAKTPHVAVPEIVGLAERLDADYLVCADTALPKNHIRVTVPQLAESLKMRRRSFFFEVRVDIPKEELRAFSQLGNVVLQPGIESLSTPLLTHMRKGTSAIQNIQFLRWCRIFGILPYYNILHGFPGEDPTWYVGMKSLMRHVFHLSAPRTATQVMLLRNSPLLREGGQHLGVVKPWDEYRIMYPAVDAESLDDLAYYFNGDFSDIDGEGIKPRADLISTVREWQRADRSGTAFLMRDKVDGGSCAVYDGRMDSAVELTLDSVDAAILDAGDEATDLDGVCEKLERGPERATLSSHVLQRLFDMAGKGLVLEERGKFLDLTIPINIGGRS